MTVIADEDARRRACVEFVIPLVVVAGAGTGKTTTLVARVATWLVGPGFDEARAREGDPERAADRALDGVLAITFTKAAAAEMDARVRGALRELESGKRPTGVVLPFDAALPEDLVRERARMLRLALDRPLATTIHGFCQSLLAEHPFESGLAPGFTVDADEDLVGEFARRAATEDLGLAFRDARDEDWLTLARDGVGPDVVADCVTALRIEGVRAADLARDPASDAELKRLVDELQPAVRAFVPTCRILAKLRGVNIVAAAQAVIALAAMFEEDVSPSIADLVRRIAGIAEGRPLEKLKQWGTGELDDSARKVLGDEFDAAGVIAQHFGAAFRPLAEFDLDGFRARRTIVRRVLERAEALGDEAATVTFGDLLARAARLVEGERGTRERLRRRYRQILVDEFQDTDDVQVRLVRALALGEERDRPGLFLVGDPKQSIYGFRGADLAAYDGFVDEVRAAGGETLELVQNFRSTPRVLAAVERFVSPVMLAEHGVQPGFQRLEPIGKDEGPEVEVWVTWAAAPAERSLAKTTMGTARRIEAAQLARSLAAERVAGAKWKDMAVLTRSRTGLEPCFEALREAGIPYQVEGDRSYYRRREVVDAAALLGAIVDPGDVLSLLAFLRSSACGLPDAALEALWADGFASDAQLLGGPSGERALVRIAQSARTVESALESRGFPGGRGIPQFAASLEHALASLAILRRSLVDDPADRFLEHLRALVLVEAAESCRYQGHFRAANLERFLRRVGEALEESGDATGVLRALRRSIDEAEDEREARPPSDVEDAVRFLTIHGAKGLEFGAVFLLGLASGTKRGKARDGLDRETGALRVCGMASPNFTAVVEATERRDAAERARLLYVAMTRAKHKLVLSAVWRTSPVLRAARTAANFRDLAEHGCPKGFGERAEAALAAGTREYVEDGFVVRVVPTEPSGGERRTVLRVDSGLIERARRESEVLARLAPLADLRANRPRVATASSRALEAGTSGPMVPSWADTLVASAIPREDARVAGTLVHGALELAPDFDAARARLAAVALASGADVTAIAAARAILDAVERGPLAARFRDARATIAARELALLVPARAGDAPIEAFTGSADLVLRDGDAWTVVDFKSEALGGRDPRVAAREHTAQLDLYARALGEALALDSPPRREVWFLKDGVAVECV